MPSPAPVLNFPPACLTPLYDQDIRALQSLTAGWSPPNPARGTTASTLGPAAYRRLRLRRAALCAGLVLAMMVLMPTLIVVLAAVTDDPAWHNGRVLTVLYYFSAGGIVLSVIAAALGWHFTGGQRRITAGAEPATHLVLAATTTGLAITFGTGHRLAGAWSRWRLSHVRSEIIYMKHRRVYILESATLVFYPEDGSQAASALLDPITLDKGHDFAATVVAMITSNVRT